MSSSVGSLFTCFSHSLYPEVVKLSTRPTAVSDVPSRVAVQGVKEMLSYKLWDNLLWANFNHWVTQGRIQSTDTNSEGSMGKSSLTWAKWSE